MKRVSMICLLALSACTPAAVTAEPPATAPSAVPAPTPTPVPPAATGVIAQAGTVILTGERAFAVAELTYTTAANGVARLVDAGLIRGATATRVRAWNAEARAALVKGKAIADVAERARLAAQLFGLADKLNTVAGVR